MPYINLPGGGKLWEGPRTEREEMELMRRINGGGTGIRTLEGFNTLLVFKTSAFDHSAIPPARRMMKK